MSDEAVQLAASKILAVMAEMPTDDLRQQLIAGVVRSAMEQYSAREQLASFIAGVLDLQGIALTTISHAGEVLVEATYHTEATDAVKSVIGDAVQMLRDYLNARPDSEHVT